MSKLDGLKEGLKILRFWLGVAVASFLAIISWLATNYNKTELWLIVVSTILLFGFAITIYLISKRISKTKQNDKEVIQTKKDDLDGIFCVWLNSLRILHYSL